MTPAPPLPEIPECTVTRDKAGTYHLTHSSGDTATAETVEQVDIQASILRIAAAWRTGDLP